MAPAIAEPAGSPVPRGPLCEVAGETITLANPSLCCGFTTTGGRLALQSLRNEFTAGEVLLQPGLPALFVVEANGKRLTGSREFGLTSVSRVDNGFSALLASPDGGLAVGLRVTIDAEGLRFAARFTNRGTTPLDLKVAFPCMGGLRLSDRVEDDYYYFPWGGGVFSSRPTVMRLGYGDSQALWQVMDVFSPARGGGVYLRADDDKGYRKTMSLRHSVPGLAEQIADLYMRNTTKAEYLWQTSAIEPQEGTGLALEYLRRTRQPGESYEPPAAILAAHAGNWKTAMVAYAAWAHRVWDWRPYPSRLVSAFNLGIAGWPSAPLFARGKYRDDFLQPAMDAVEITSWWNWASLGPGGVPLDGLSPEVLKEVGPYLIADPVTGRTMFMGCGSDYTGYNERFGGRDALREAIAANRRGDRLITLYLDPFRLGDEFSNETAKRFGNAWNFVWQDGKQTRNGLTRNPCFYLAEVQDWLVATAGRVLGETGADGIRLDEVGYPYGACFATDHRHVPYEEVGLGEWNKAMAETVRRVRRGMDRVNPAAVLMTEHPGYDYLFCALDGCLSYDLSLMDTWGTPAPESVRVLEVNLQRFYFPECKLFEINLYGRDAEHKRTFWNGVACFNYALPVPFHTIYRENADVYASRDCEALVPTLVRRIYANRFAAGGKTFFHLYNATGRDYSGPLLRVPKPAGYHVFDMLGCRDLEAEGSTPVVVASLKGDDVACIALLPAQLTVRREGDLLRVLAAVTAGGQRLAVCGLDGGVLLEQGLHGGENQVRLPSAPPAGWPEPAVVKLLAANGSLLDARGLAEHGVRVAEP